jgi:hypothetical protein
MWAFLWLNLDDGLTTTASKPTPSMKRRIPGLGVNLKGCAQGVVAALKEDDLVGATGYA